MRRIHTLTGMVALAVALGLPAVRAQEADPATEAAGPEPRAGLDLEMMAARARAGGAQAGASEKKYRDFAEVTKGATKSDGLFTLYQKDDHLYAEIKPPQLDQPVLAPIAIARGLEMAGN